MKKSALLLAAATGAALTALALRKWNSQIETTRVTYSSSKLPPAFDSFKIAHLSDLHNHLHGAKQARLLEILRRAQPDIIVLTGDLIDRNHPGIANALLLVEQAAAIADLYFAPGNHEAQSDEYIALLDALAPLPIRVLDNQKEILYRDGAVIELCGVRDPMFAGKSVKSSRFPAIMANYLRETLGAPSSNLRILLAHRPELLPVYAGQGVDLVLSGHAHGGQWRIPGLGGLFAPNQGFLPRWVEGLHQLDSTALVVSRGLSNYLFPPRIGNRPEIVLVTLETADCATVE